MALTQILCGVVLLSAMDTAHAENAHVTVGDAYIQSAADETRWSIGTRCVEQVFEWADGQFRLMSYRNQCGQPAIEYVDQDSACAPFSLDIDSFTGGQPLTNDFSAWKLESAKALQVDVGGRPAAQLNCILTRGEIRVDFHVLAFPGTAILRQWLEIENCGAQSVVLASPVSACWRLRSDENLSYTHSWMQGGHAAPNQGQLERAPITKPYSRTLECNGTSEFVPWTALHRSEGSRDGWFMALEYLGRWSLAVNQAATGPLTATAFLPELKSCTLAAGQRLELPWVTLGVFRDGLDNMAASLYDWQYAYLWDYTNNDYYARSRCTAWWFYCSQNLQEQFTARLASLDMNTSDAMRTMGYEILWDDAGWSSYPGHGLPPDAYGSVFSQTYEGPDFSQTQQYLHKTGMRWLLWFAGRPSAGVLDSKIGAWGDFEWRTDGVAFPNMTADKSFRAEVERFLDVHPASSFHTCSGGSTYAHTFEIGGRYSSYNYLSDAGRGPNVNHYFSYLEPPDRWGDILVSLASIYGRKDGSTATMAEVLAARAGAMPKPEDLRYVRDSGRGMLTAVPSPYWGRLPAEDGEWARTDMELFRFFRCEGLAGRWSYVFHPAVEGDQEYYYFQRTSHDRRKACIILTHRAENPVAIYPRGLLPECRYVIGFDSMHTVVERTGADLMSHGIAIEDQKPGELVYLNLPNRPGSGQDHVPPQSPGRVLVCRETNIGHSGIGVYWSPGMDNNWISYYEVRRGETIVDKVAIGNYYFDHAAGWEGRHEYSVRTVDGDGNASRWTVAEPTKDEPLTFASLGGHFDCPGRDGWSQETTVDHRVFTPMTWVPPANNPAADFGGTPNQPGGVEGYWEGPGGSRVGRGWQQASNTEDCIRAWTAPRTGTVYITGRAMREYYHRAQGGPLRVRIQSGQRQIWPEADWATVAADDLTGAAHDIKLDVTAGDTLRFVLDEGSIPEHDLIAWMPRIVYDEVNSPRLAPVTVRILCGSQSSYADHCGNVWTADQHFAGGAPVSTTETIEDASPTSHDQTLYQHGRAGKEFMYAISVPAGRYAVRLKFAESTHRWMFERPINLDINGQRMLSDFDIVQAAQGPKRAVERAFRNILPNAEGKITLRFVMGQNPLGTCDDAMVQAIEILPEQNLAIRVNAGSNDEFIDWNSCPWAADGQLTGQSSVQSASPVVHASPTLYDQQLYRTARCGRNFRYTLAAPPGLYGMHLKFAELWLSQPGERPMDIAINGRLVRKSWDPATAAGCIGMAVDLRFDNITPDQEGHIVIDLAATGAHDAILQAIEIE
ncbi:MAG: malectin domain-containing carbohydrate-binding protein [Pirellulaceae bacterium]